MESARFLQRVKAFAPVRILVHGGLLVIAVTLHQLLLRSMAPSALRVLVFLAGALVFLLLYRSSVRLMERRSAREADFRAPDFLVGAAIGAFLIASVYLILYAIHVAHEMPGNAAGLAGGLASAFLAAVQEELLLRAIFFRIVEEMAGTLVAVILSALLFGLAHSFNPGATLTSSLAIALEAGILLALAYALTRNLWLAAGLHMGWNFTEGNVFGAAVSGYNHNQGLMHVALKGPNVLTGGAFGPEASVITVLVCLAAASVIAVMLVRRRAWKPVHFRLFLD